MIDVRRLRLGTRASRLALAQAELAAEGLRSRGAEVELVALRTVGDELSERHPTGNWQQPDGQFTGELERALLDGRIDVAVHSLKDLPTTETAGVTIGAVPVREDPRDCLVSRHADGVAGLPPGATVGTGSVRRTAQLLALRPDLACVPIRGNVDTRLARVEAGEYDAVVLAAAGLRRLGVEPSDDAWLPYEAMLPAPGQGALALQSREAEEPVLTLLAGLDDPAIRLAVEVERRLLKKLGGGCLAPLGALAEVNTGQLRLRAAFQSDLGTLRRVDLSAPLDDVRALVERAAERLTAEVAA